MADVSVLTFNGAPRNVKDVTARNTANAATTAQEYDRQQLTGTYKGRSIESVFAAPRCPSRYPPCRRTA